MLKKHPNKKDNDKKSQNKLKTNPDKDNQQHIKILIKSLLIIMSLIAIGLYFHLNREEPFAKSEVFFESRKTPESFFEYKEEEQTAKKKAERNIFLQD